MHFRNKSIFLKVFFYCFYRVYIFWDDSITKKRTHFIQSFNRVNSVEGQRIVDSIKRAELESQLCLKHPTTLKRGKTIASSEKRI
jgi:hypothetical protein